MSNNALDPKVYQVTKILDLFPQGIIKMSLKQDELNLDRDNLDLQICDFYTSSGDLLATSGNTDASNIESVINQYIVDEYGELSLSDTISNQIKVGVSSYYSVVFSNNEIEPVWNIELVDNEQVYTDEKRAYYCGLIKLTMYNPYTVIIKPGKASSLIGKTFRLYVDDLSGNRYTSIDLEVIA